eukprot:m.210865 g.210865  ORF g.210865 m.210865 type:complete len:450 (-) comp15490_c0_seq2:9671-11020(-)
MSSRQSPALAAAERRRQSGGSSTRDPIIGRGRHLPATRAARPGQRPVPSAVSFEPGTPNFLEQQRWVDHRRRLQAEETSRSAAVRAGNAASARRRDAETAADSTSQHWVQHLVGENNESGESEIYADPALQASRRVCDRPWISTGLADARGQDRAGDATPHSRMVDWPPETSISSDELLARRLQDQENEAFKGAPLVSVSDLSVPGDGYATSCGAVDDVDDFAMAVELQQQYSAERKRELSRVSSPDEAFALALARQEEAEANGTDVAVALALESDDDRQALDRRSSERQIQLDAEVAASLSAESGSAASGMDPLATVALERTQQDMDARLARHLHAQEAGPPRAIDFPFRTTFDVDSDPAHIEVSELNVDDLDDVPIPLPKHKIDAKTHAAPHSGRPIACTICQGPIEVGEMARRLPCTDAFHDACILEWFKRKPTCPTCRIDVRTNY